MLGIEMAEELCCDFSFVAEFVSSRIGGEASDGGFDTITVENTELLEVESGKADVVRVVHELSIRDTGLGEEIRRFLEADEAKLRVSGDGAQICRKPSEALKVDGVI